MGGVQAPPCPSCGSCARALSWSTFGNGTRHIREECSECGRWVRWAPQTAENVALADAGPGEVEQMALAGFDDLSYQGEL